MTTYTFIDGWALTRHARARQVQREAIRAIRARRRAGSILSRSTVSYLTTDVR